MSEGIARKFYSCKAWVKCRNAYRDSVYNLCELCGKPGDIVHHKIMLNSTNINNAVVTLDWSNLMFVCKECHNNIHMSAMARRGVAFDREGNIVKI